MLEAGVHNLQIRQGKLYDRTFTWKINSIAVDLTGYTARLKMYTSSAVTILLLTTTLDATGNGIILGGAAGTVRVVVKTAKTATLTFNKCNYELELRRPDNEDIPFLKGNAYLTPETVDP